MATNFIAKTSILVDAPTSKVWEALITPSIIKEYLYGTNVTSDWTVGSSITYTGEWQGKQYEDKGTILQLIPEKLLESTYWSGMSGLEDIPENYNKVTYELETEGNQTRLTISQDNVKDEAGREQAEKNWAGVLQSLKALLEKE